MYYAMAYYPNEWGNFNVRAIRTKGYRTLESAINAVKRVGHDGFVKQLGVSTPVWSN